MEYKELDRNYGLHIYPPARWPIPNPIQSKLFMNNLALNQHFYEMTRPNHCVRQDKSICFMTIGTVRPEHFSILLKTILISLQFIFSYYYYYDTSFYNLLHIYCSNFPKYFFPTLVFFIFVLFYFN